MDRANEAQEQFIQAGQQLQREQEQAIRQTLELQVQQQQDLQQQLIDQQREQDQKSQDEFKKQQEEQIKQLQELQNLAATAPAAGAGTPIVTDDSIVVENPALARGSIADTETERKDEETKTA